MVAASGAAAVRAQPQTMESSILFQRARQRFGSDPWDWAFQCPACGHVATARDFPVQYADQVSVACARLYGESPVCRWLANNEHSPGPWKIIMPDGQEIFCFALARPRITVPVRLDLLAPAEQVEQQEEGSA